jgi:hypothetical protein
VRPHKIKGFSHRSDGFSHKVVEIPESFGITLIKAGILRENSRKLPGLPKLTRNFPHNKLLFCGHKKFDRIWYNGTEPQNNKLVGTDNAARLTARSPVTGGVAVQRGVMQTRL